jgi:hypothetical protein
MQKRPPERPIYRVAPRPLPGTDGTRALRRLLKLALRVCRLRCVGVEACDDAASLHGGAKAAPAERRGGA